MTAGPGRTGGEWVVDALRAEGVRHVFGIPGVHNLAIYDALLAKIMASTPKPESKLEDATGLSNIYRDMAQLHRRAGQTSQASDFDSRRLNLWQHWDRRLPNNSFVRRQISAIPANR